METGVGGNEMTCEHENVTYEIEAYCEEQYEEGEYYCTPKICKRCADCGREERRIIVATEEVYLIADKCFREAAQAAEDYLINLEEDSEEIK